MKGMSMKHVKVYQRNRDRLNLNLEAMTMLTPECIQVFGYFVLTSLETLTLQIVFKFMFNILVDAFKIIDNLDRFEGSEKEFLKRKRMDPRTLTRLRKRKALYNEVQPTRKQKRRKRVGSGRKRATLTDGMCSYLLSFVTLLRGPKPEKSKPEVLENIFEEEEKSEVPLTHSRKKDPELLRPNPEKSEQEEIFHEEVKPDILSSSQAAEPSPAVVEVVNEDNFMNLLVEESDGEEIPIAADNFEKAFAWEETDLLLQHEGAPVKCSYRNLVNQIQLNWPGSFKARSREAWYQAIRRWCISKELKTL